MSPTAQAKLLRVLQEREFLRLGSTRPVKANVRVIAASNRDLQKAVADGDFREDLFYRLQVFDIRMTPLRERRGDIPLLIDAFLLELNRSTGCSAAGLTADALEMLVGYEWRGNVRELHNALERAAILCEGGLSRRTISPFGPRASWRRRDRRTCLTSSGEPSSRHFTKANGTRRSAPIRDYTDTAVRSCAQVRTRKGLNLRTETRQSHQHR
jgi:transcriptional regulator with GAF, ATPase, and Fis domain